MSIIAVHGFALKHTLMDVIKILAKAIQGPFEALNFKTPKGQPKLKPKLKTVYLRLSEKLDPVRVVERINDYNYRMKTKFKPFIPDEVPDIPLGVKPKRLPLKLRIALKIPDDNPIEEVLALTTEEILMELQAKYPGLYLLSKKIGHKLLQEISKKIFTRLKEISDSSPETGESCFKLSRAYRRAHPHFGDFQLVLSTLHGIQDAAGTTRSQLEETELASAPTAAQMLDMPTEKVKQLCHKYSDKITDKVLEHIKELPSEISPTDNEEEIARKQVRVELKKLIPYMPQVVHHVVNRHLLPKDGPFYRIRIYGEPFLPNKETMAPFLSRYRPVKVLRSTRMYNMLKFSVPPSKYSALVAMNGTVLNGAKLMIRCSDMPHYRVHQANVEDEEEEEEPVDPDFENYGDVKMQT